MTAVAVTDARNQRVSPFLAPTVGDAVEQCRNKGLDRVFISVDGDIVRPGALETMADALEQSDVVYADEDWLDDDGRRVRPYHKPRWSPERLRSQMYLTGVVGYRIASWEAHDMPVIDTALSIHDQLYALALWATDRTERVTHCPTIGCHRRLRGSTSTAIVASLERSYARAGMQVSVSYDAATRRATWEPTRANPPLVSIIMPTGGGHRVVGGRRIRLVDNAIRSILDRSTLGRFTRGTYEIVVVTDRATDHAVGRQLTAYDPSRLRIVADQRPFNFSAAINLGAANAEGDVLVLLNDDTEIVTPNWLERLSCLALADGVGAVGVRLDYGDGRLQHAGVTGRHGSADHRYRGYPVDTAGHGDEVRLTHNVLAVTAACLAVSREHWQRLGGLDEAFPLNYNDLDLCLRLYEAGLRNVQDNGTILNHLETSSRTSGSELWEDELLRSRWSSYLHDDPYDNPLLVPLGFSPLAPPATLNRLREVTGDPPPARFGPRSNGLVFRS